MLTGFRIVMRTFLYAEPADRSLPAVPRRATAEELGRDVAILAAFQGPGQPRGELWGVFGPEQARRVGSWIEKAALDAADEGDAEALVDARGEALCSGRVALVGEQRRESGDDWLGYVVDRVEDGRVRLVLDYGGEGDAVLLPAGKARELAAGLARAVDALDETPPLVLPDRGVAEVTGVTSRRVFTVLGVEVRQGVSDPADPRLVVGFLGSWALDDDTARRLADALDRAATSLAGDGEAPTSFLELTESSTFGGERPWLVVRSSLALGLPRPTVELQISDEIVEERGEDGVVHLLGDEPARLSRALEEALRHASEHPPYLFIPPEPGHRVVVEVSWS